jgi:N-acetylglucosamine malate deacetylase 1
MSTTTQRNILILAPHCDDAEFGLGASIQRWREEGASVHVLIASCSDYSRADGQNVCGKGRLIEARAAFEHLGVNSWKSAGWFKENQALACDYGRLVSQIEGEIKAINPSEVYVCLPSFNQDHRVLYDATLTAFRPGAQLASLYGYEYPGNAWGPNQPEHGRRYLIVDHDEMATKIEALDLHKSQFEGRTAGVRPQAALVLATQRGAEIGTKFAELVYVLKEIH